MRIFTIILLTLTFQFSIGQISKAYPFEVGASSSVVNPNPGDFIAGHTPNRKFEGILDDLYAKVLYISDGPKSIVLVTIDCIGFLHSDLISIREEVNKYNPPFSAENIIISSTHTHSGPDVVGLWGENLSKSGVNPDYMKFLIQSISNAIADAYKNRKAANVLYAETSFGEGWVENICQDEIDRSVNSLIFKDKNNDIIATITNFACHPTFLDGVHNEVSADFIGTYYKNMKNAFGGEHLYLQGAIGGWVQPVTEKGSFSGAEKMGNELADAVKFSFSNARKLKGKKILFKHKTFPFKVDNPGWKQLSAAGVINREVGDFVDSEIAFFKIGEAQFITHPGESSPYHSLKSKEMMDKGPKFVLGLSQDALGYILKPEFFTNPAKLHAEYLTKMSLGIETGDKMLEIIESLIK